MKYRPCGYLKIIVILQPFKYYYLCDGNITQMCLLIKSRIEMRKNLFYYLFTVLCTATLFISCSDDEDTPNPVNPLVGVYSLSDYETADFVVATLLLLAQRSLSPLRCKRRLLHWPLRVKRPCSLAAQVVCWALSR